MGLKKAKAFAPCHITGVFQIFDEGRDALYVGSRGAGVSLSCGVETTVEVEESSKDSAQISVNGLFSDRAQVSSRVLGIFESRFREVRNSHIYVKHQVGVPIGAGLGSSGAAALSLALALDQALGLGLSSTEAAQVAHVAEVQCKTGLGTVIAEAIGGLEIRVKAGAPGIGEIRRVPIPKSMGVACLVFGPLSTRKCLTDESIRKRISDFGGKMVDALEETPTAQSFMKTSRRFAEHVGLITDRVRAVLNETDKVGVVCSMPMFGECVFTMAERSDLKKVLQVFQEHGQRGVTIVSEVDQEGARLLQ
jgi:pantoate kinase